MSDNPYTAPSPAAPRQGEAYPASNARQLLNGPALGLMVVSSIWIFLILIGMSFSLYLLWSGNAQQLPQPSIGLTKDVQVTIRLIWSSVILISNIVILTAAIRMPSLRSYGLCKLGAILAIIPCTGPCYLLGIPFGLWALVVLGKPGVGETFTS